MEFMVISYLVREERKLVLDSEVNPSSRLVAASPLTYWCAVWILSVEISGIEIWAKT